MDEAPPRSSADLSEDRFLAWAEGRPGRYELVEGRVVMHAGATRNHETIAKRVFVALHAQCDEAVHDVNKGDFGVRIRPGRGQGSIYYPDVVVDLQSGDGRERATTTAIVIVEVLSASTGYTEHVAKFAAYRALAGLRHYVVLERSVPRAYLWRKGQAGWPAEPEIREGLEAVLAFPEIGAAVALADIHGGPRSLRA